MGVGFQIKYHPRVIKEDLPKLTTSTKNRIRKAIEQKLAIDPTLFGVPLRQSLKGHRKLRVGDYRIIFRIEKQYIYISAILHRSVVYKDIKNRR